MTDNSENTDIVNNKNNVLLKYVNAILTNIGKEPIENLTDFKEIERLDVIKEENFESLVLLKDEIFAHFDCRQCGWYKRKSTKNYVLSFLRYALTDINLKLIYKEQRKQTDGHVVSKILYSIIS